MKAFLGTLVLFTSTTSFAATSINDFLGTYSLIDQKVEGETFCHERLTVSLDTENAISLFGPSSSYGPMISAKLNGEPRKNSASHGEAMSSRKGQDTVTFKNDTLTFQYSGVNKLMGVPVSRETDTFSLKVSADSHTLKVTRIVFEGVAAGIGSTGKALCTYSK